MEHGSGKKDREDKWSGTEILRVESFVIINLTEPLRVDRQVTQRKRSLPDSSGSSRPILHGECEKIEDN